MVQLLHVDGRAWRARGGQPVGELRGMRLDLHGARVVQVDISSVCKMRHCVGQVVLELVPKASLRPAYHHSRFHEYVELRIFGQIQGRELLGDNQ